MKEKIDFTNPELSEPELVRCRELADKLRVVASDDVVVQKLIRSLELGYFDAAQDYYRSNRDKFRQVSKEALKIIEEELQ